MRTKQKTKIILVTPDVHKKLVEDKKHFQKVIGGGKWSFSDTITEYYKIMNGLKTSEKHLKSLIKKEMLK